MFLGRVKRVSGPRPAGRVLVIDDDALVSDAIARTLATSHAVTVVDRAEDALALIRAGERYDVILCDVVMPAMSGPELHARLTAIAPAEARRIVFVTGCALLPEVRRYLDTVPNTCLEKPIEADALRAFVDRRVRPEHVPPERSKTD